MVEIVLNRDQYLELEKIGLGAFAPLTGFMTEAEYRSVVADMRLPDGAVFPLPVVLDLDAQAAARIEGGTTVALMYAGEHVGDLTPTSRFRTDRIADAKAVFGTSDSKHPGVRHFTGLGEVFVGGPIVLHRRVPLDISHYELTPQQTKAIFRERGWRRIVGFQTRNVPHRAHEYLQKIALEQVDGIFVQPLVGRKKTGDFAPEAVMTAYRTLIDGFFPKNRAVLGILSTVMRYAGPREALFHALIRRNYGCTHFIIGRDHAGVGSYYGKYDAHALARRFDGEIGIEIMALHGPYHCRRCGGIVTEHTCPHPETAPDAVREISGTDMRAILVDGQMPDPALMRPEIVESVKGMKLFVEESDS